MNNYSLMNSPCPFLNSPYSVSRILFNFDLVTLCHVNESLQNRVCVNLTNHVEIESSNIRMVLVY